MDETVLWQRTVGEMDELLQRALVARTSDIRVVAEAIDLDVESAAAVIQYGMMKMTGQPLEEHTHVEVYRDNTNALRYRLFQQTE